MSELSPMADFCPICSARVTFPGIFVHSIRGMYSKRFCSGDCYAMWVAMRKPPPARSLRDVYGRALYYGKLSGASESLMEEWREKKRKELGL